VSPNPLEFRGIKAKRAFEESAFRFGNISHLSILCTNKKSLTVDSAVNKKDNPIRSTTIPKDSVVQRASNPEQVTLFARVSSDGKSPLTFLFQGVNMNASSLDIVKK
jgi:hypothetical protein